MAKTKQQNGPTTKSREQQRNLEQKSKQSTSSRTRSRNIRRRTSRQRPWLLIGGVLLGLALIVGVFLFLANQQSSNSGTQGQTDVAVLNMVSTVKPSVLAQVGTGGIQNILQGTPAGTRLLTGPNGRPQFFYYGAEFCPYCAAQRWAVVVALSRFGTFTQLPETTSASDDIFPNTATFTFYHSAYSSSYLDFVPVEAQDRNRHTLQIPTADQQQIINQYNFTGFPSIDIANRYLILGPLFSPDVLTGLSQKDIASQLSDPTSRVAQNILGSANYMTAAMCVATHNQPASVCTAAPIPSIEQSLPHTALSSGGVQVAAIPESLVIDTRWQVRNEMASMRNEQAW
ncbi:MAG: DUF929 family protein [Ktedonobacteraceae bacterium]|nr:DUF929 family protein [Ktedonobacteraceae bacterium]